MKINWGSKGRWRSLVSGLNPCACTVGPSVLGVDPSSLSTVTLSSRSSACMAAHLRLGSPTWPLSGLESMKCGLLPVNHFWLSEQTPRAGWGNRSPTHWPQWPWSHCRELPSLSSPRCLEDSTAPLGDQAHSSRTNSGWLERRIAPFSYCFTNA